MMMLMMIMTAMNGEDDGNDDDDDEMTTTTSIVWDKINTNNFTIYKYKNPQKTLAIYDKICVKS